jgi:transcriptional regulator with XRE-family HTH domain
MPDTFGERLKKARKDKWMKQCQLADKIGISRPHLSMLERDKVQPTITTLEWICKALDVSATELLGW